MKIHATCLFLSLAFCASRAFAIADSAKFPFKKGINFSGLEDGTYSANDYTRRYLGQDSTYTSIKAKGFDHVRLAVDFRRYYTASSQTLKSSISNVDMVVDKCEENGLYVFLDFHGWSSINTTNGTDRVDFLKIWELVADHYKDRSDYVIFELINEPHTTEGGNLDAGKLNELQAEVMPIIRQTNPNRLVLLAAAEWNGPWKLTDLAIPASFGRVGVVCHTYGPLNFTHQGATWGGHSTDHVSFTSTDKTETGTKDLDNALRWIDDFQEKTGIPVVMNEFGVNKSQSQATDAETLDWTSYVARNCESNGIAWSWWEYNRGFGAYYNGQWRAPVMNGLFPAEPAGNTYASSFNAADYAKSMTISFPGYAGTSALSGFPVLVKLSTAITGFSYADFERTGGDDLRFTDSSGNLIPHEIDTWNPNGVSTVWVKVPSLTSATTITAHYGCALPVAVDSSDVWDDDYVGVWHLGEGGLPLRESSLASTDFTKQNGSGIQYASSGIVGGSIDFGASGNSRMVTAHDCDALDGFTNCTVEAWTYQTSHTTAAILSKRYSASKNLSYFLYDNGAKTQFNVATTDSTSGNSAQITPALNQWTHQAYTFSAGTLRGYQDGAKVGSDKTLSFSTINASDGYLHLGNFSRQNYYNADTRNFPGKIDEVRISKVARSADWLQATHDTIANANFATYAVDDGEPPPSPVGYGPLATNLYAKSMNVLFAGVQDNATLTNFPVLVRLSTDIEGFRYSDFNRPNGGDLRFADANGNLLPHEIDTWDESGVSTVWVRVPLLTKKSYITAHYGFTGTGDPAEADPKDVWDDDYVGVWHLGESALPLKESSETSSDFETAYGETIHYATNGIVGGSVGFSEGGLYNSIVAPDHDALDGFGKFTVEFWTHQDEHKQNAGILAKRIAYNNQAAYYFYDAYDNKSDSWYIPFCIGTNSATSARWSFNQSQTLGDWNHIVYSADMTVTNKNVHGFKNGTMNGWEPNVEFLATMPNSSAPLILGNLGANNKDQSFNGRIDEVRISKTVRSKEWIKATHDTVRNAGFAVCSFGEIDFGESITNLLLKARTDKSNPIDYVENETIRFDFWLDGVVALPLEVKAKEPLHVIWTRTADDGVTVKGTNAISLAEGFSMTTSLATNGIVKLTGTLVGSDYKAISYVNPSDGKTKNITFGGGAGVATEKMQLSTVEPADFDQFWAEAKAKLATVPFDDSNVELVDVTPSNLASSYTIYAAKIPCYGPRPVTGWLTVPKNPQVGGVPIQANFDGYGCISAAPKVPTYGAGQLVRFAVNAHGYDMIGHDDQYYQDFRAALYPSGRNSYGLEPSDYDNPTNTYFYYMALRVVRAFEYLKTRPEWNGRDVIAAGGSQGGLQTMWAGGLVDGITKISPSITWGCDIGCPWNGQGPYPSRSWGIPSVPGAFYFDSALHAKRVPRDCVANITRLGMGDYTCPPRGVLLSYYNMKCEVSAYLVQGSDHGYVPPDPNQTFTITKAADSGVSVSLSNAAAAPGFCWTNATATVTVSDASSVPEGAKVRLTVSDASGAVLGTVDKTWSGTGEYAFDTAEAISGTAFADGFDYTLAFTVVDSEGNDIGDGAGAAAMTALRLGAEAPWFSADAATATVAGGVWTETPAIENGAYVVGTNTSFTATAGREGYTRIEFTFPGSNAVPASFLPELLAFAAQKGERASIIAVTGNDGSSVWHGLVQENGAPVWRALEGADASSPSGTAAFELDTTAATPRVSYFVWDEGAAPPTFVRLHDANGVEWFDAPGSGATMAGRIDFQGDGAVCRFAGQLLDKAVAEADGVRYDSLAEALAAGDVTLLTNAEWPADTPAGTMNITTNGHTLLRGGVAVAGGTVVVDSGPVALAGEGTIRVTFANLANIGVATAGLSPAELAAALAEDGANGIPKWQSYVLGLSTTDPAALPRADIAVEGGNALVSDRGITVNESAGATVTYQVIEIPDLSSPNVATNVGPVAVPGTPIPLPMGNATSRFFRIKVSIDVP